MANEGSGTKDRSEIMVRNVTGTGEEGKNISQDPTERDLLLGKQAINIYRITLMIALLACVGAAIFVFMNVPSETRMPYDGKYDRSGAGIPMQIALLLAPAFLLKLWWPSGKPDMHRMGRKSRIGVHVVGPLWAVVCLTLQWFFVKSILTLGGYFAGYGVFE
ncbi:hypothetical protein ACIPVK_09520 [Paeniglutamicibacter sp. MACA_103]|uniref:hypothetical protein n=1 Tax=Paeniglutamicibacter sp. MACA_103 TaxID=3377337 RepID=UPI0038964A48